MAGLSGSAGSGGQNKKMLIPRSGNINRGGQKFIGIFGFLVLNLQFSDHVHRTLPSRYDINTLMNRVGQSRRLYPRDLIVIISYGVATVGAISLRW